MHKKVLWGVGLKKNLGHKMDPAWPPGLYEALLEDTREYLDFDGKREARATELREHLERAGIKYAGWECKDLEEWSRWYLTIDELGENSFEQLAAFWLIEFSSLKHHRAILVAGKGDQETLTIVIKSAEELGRLEERIFWRTKPVPGTESTASPEGKSPEELALERLPQREALVRRNQGRARLNAKRKRQAEGWRDQAQALACGYWDRHPKASKLEAAAYVHKELAKLWRTAGGEGEGETLRLPSENTIRRFIDKPVRA